jgi:hypothetical protein
MARVEAGDGGHTLGADEAGLRTKALDLLPFPMEHVQEGPKNGAQISLGLDRSYRDTRRS